jgi:hypothetical protein
MSASNYLEEKLLDHLFGKAAYTAPTIYVALFTSDPGETGASGEVSGGDYARELLGATTRTNSSVANDAAVEFTTATANWGTVTHFGLFDALTSGNFLGGGVLTSSKVVNTGDTVRFSIGAITFTAD